MKIVYVLIALCLLLSGCRKTDVPATLPAMEITESDFSFELPDGYTFADEAAASISILKEDQVVGGIVNTGLPASALDEKGHRTVCMYLESLGPVPLICEYIVMDGGDFLAVTLAITNPDTDVRTETSRRVFEHESLCYDLWFDDALISEDEQSLVRKSVLEIN